MSGFSRNKCLAFPGIPLLPEGNSVNRPEGRPEGNSVHDHLIGYHQGSFVTIGSYEYPALKIETLSSPQKDEPSNNHSPSWPCLNWPGTYKWYVQFYYLPANLTYMWRKSSCCFSSEYLLLYFAWVDQRN